ncbi:MAG: hypothetical protein U9N51_04610 [Bacteroidota bacterium]|nr:hypothetical protein [Bacteroidota bacterium]
MTIIEKIIANHSGKTNVNPGNIVDIIIDARVARDFGGANIVKNFGSGSSRQQAAISNLP